MTKKQFDTSQAINKFFTQPTEETQQTQKTHDTQDTSKVQKKYRLNLNLDGDLEPYLKEVAWINRTSITQYLNDLIRKDMENHKDIKEGLKNE